MADVVCNNFTGRVIELKLGNHFTYIGSVAELHANYRKSKLVGKVSPSLVDFKHLIHGIQIPIYIASLENLRYLNLSSQIWRIGSTPTWKSLLLAIS